jgi:pyruvate,water dikinase
MAITTGVKIIDNLNIISNDRYAALLDRFNKINAAVEELLAGRRVVPFSKFTISFDEINREMTDIVGAKNANLGELRNRPGIPTPDGFAVSSFAFEQFMEYNAFRKINQTLYKLQTDNLELLNSTSREIQEEIAKAEIPPDIEKEILDAYSGLCDKYGRQVKVSVRSSALQEDGIFSFAGQYSTFLNVPSDLILRKYKEVVASLFTTRAIFYYKTKGFQEYEMAMPVGILAMVDAKEAGVIHTRDPNTPEAETIIINAVRGMGRCALKSYNPNIHSFKISLIKHHRKNYSRRNRHGHMQDRWKS